MMRRFGLRDDQWGRIKDLLPRREGSGRGDRGGQSTVRGGRALPLSHGMPWRDLPERFGDGVQVHRRCSRRAKSGVRERVFQQLAADADNEYAIIDSTIVRAHQHSAGVQKKRARTRRSGAQAAG
jgi:transposase